MSIDALLTEIEGTGASHWIAKANHLFMAGLQVVHVIGFILLLASLLLISLRLLGLVFTSQAIPQVARGTTRLLWLGLALAVISGAIMFIGAPKHYFYNPAFGTKMLLLAVSVIVQATLFARVALSEEPHPVLARVGVGLALAFWFAVSLAGRAIGFV
jgi:uncharacterized protein DUF6644